MPIPVQIPAAHELANLTEADLVAATGLPMATVKRVERDWDIPVSDNAVAAVVATFEGAVIGFIPKNGGGARARLCKSDS